MLDIHHSPSTPDEEKGEVDLIEVLPVSSDGLHHAAILTPPVLTPEEEKRLWRKIDMRLIPIAVALYLFNNLDKANIGNAKLEGLITQLDLTGGRYNVALVSLRSHTWFSLILSSMCLQSNLLIKKLRPSKWLPGMALVWGIVATLMGLVKTYPQFVGLRLCLGVVEAGLSPGIYYLLSLWYPRHMLQWRYGLFWGGATLSGAFSGLLAYGISFMGGTGGLLGWSWIFIIEGLLTVLVAGLGFLVFVDLPGTASFLTADERSFVVHRLERDRPGGEEEHFEWRHVLDAILDWKVFLGCLTNLSTTSPLYGASLFLPSIINGFGFNAAISQLLSVPPYALATATVVTCSLYSDRIHMRSPFIFGGLLLALVGFSINISDASIGAKYFGMFFVVIGSNLCAPMVISWYGNNVVGHYKRGIGIGMQVMYGNVAGVIVSNIFRVEDAPRYLRGHLAELVLIGVGLVVVPTSALAYVHLNRRREAAEKISLEKETVMEYTEEELRRLADHAPGFRYTL
ncbi:MFS general substrate transporter [Trametes sanguinea]|nr:MFS general substrate transporter [Trametes sanguinea]